MKLSQWIMGVILGTTIMYMTSEALASTGCDGVNAGDFNRTNYTPPGSGVLNTLTGFEIGDTINFTVSGLNGSSFQLINGALNMALLSQPLSMTPVSLSYTVTGENSDTTLNTYMLVQSIPFEISITATCTPAPVPAQSQLSGANLSGEVVKTFVISRINALMLNQPSGISLHERSFANKVGTVSRPHLERMTNGIEPSSTINRNNFVFNAEQPLHFRQVLSDFIQNFGLTSEYDENQNRPVRFDAWIEGFYTGFNYDRIEADSHGHLFVGYIGTDYRISENLLIGTLVQLDSTKENSEILNSKVDGNGWMAGPYLSARLYQNVILDLRAVGGSSLSNNLEMTNVTADFDTSRWLVLGRISGDWRIGSWRFTPTTYVAYIEENLKNFTESTGARVLGQSIALGQVSFGPEISYRAQVVNMDVQPYGSIKGIWNFERPEGPLVNAQLIGIGPYWGQINSFWGRLAAGIDLLMPKGSAMRVGLIYDGLGDKNYQSLTCLGQLSVPLD